MMITTITKYCCVVILCILHYSHVWESNFECAALSTKEARQQQRGDSVFVRTALGIIKGFQTSPSFDSNSGGNNDNNSSAAPNINSQNRQNKPKRVNVFLGIPYAEPPVGKLRFRPPIPKVSWDPLQTNKTLDATQFAPDCIQSTLYYSHDHIKAHEDCLYLNIWQPAVTATTTTTTMSTTTKVKSLPVLVWIHGGGFIHGGANRDEYIGDKLAAAAVASTTTTAAGDTIDADGVIVVSLNYRLGALGFMVSTEDGLLGNQGLGDQKVALQWVHDHISSFGGDPSRVTLFGESAGAMSIVLHLLDQDHHEYDLFSAVILQSNPVGYRYRSIDMANLIGSSLKELLDCEDLRCLQSETAEEIVHMQDSLVALPRSIGDFFTWGPVLSTDDSYAEELGNLHMLRPGVVKSAALLGVPLLANVSVFQPMALESLVTVRGGSSSSSSISSSSSSSNSRSRDRIIEAASSVSDTTGNKSDSDTIAAAAENHDESHHSQRDNNYPPPYHHQPHPHNHHHPNRKRRLPMILGTNKHEGTLFVFMAYPMRMNKIIFQALVFSLFRSFAPTVMKMYKKTSEKVGLSANPDYRLVLAEVIGDYLFRCPTQLFAHRMMAEREVDDSIAGAFATESRKNDSYNDNENPVKESSVYLYEFSLPTKIPSFSCCNGLSCHTCEVPFVFNQQKVIEDMYIWPSNPAVFDAARFVNDNNGTFPAANSATGTGTCSSSATGDSDSVTPVMNTRHANKRVAQLMSHFWLSFAMYHNPNGKRVLNGYYSPFQPRLLSYASDIDIHETRDSAVDEPTPLWPDMTGRVFFDRITAVHRNSTGTATKAALHLFGTASDNTIKISDSDYIKLKGGYTSYYSNNVSSDHTAAYYDDRNDDGTDGSASSRIGTLLGSKIHSVLSTTLEHSSKHARRHMQKFEQVLAHVASEVRDRITDFKTHRFTRSSTSNNSDNNIRTSHHYTVSKKEKKDARQQQSASTSSSCEVDGNSIDTSNSNSNSNSNLLCKRQDTPILNYMVFDTTTRTHVSDKDCVCSTWNSLNYQF